MQGILTVASNTTKRKINPFKALADNSAYAQTNFHGLFKMTVNKNVAISPVLAVSFEDFFYDQM